MNTQEKIKLQKWWKDELQLLTKKVIAQEEKRKEKKSKALEEYTSRDDILDAYGMGMISAAKKDRLLDAWDNENDMDDTMYQAKLSLLQDLYQEAKQIINNLEQSEAGGM